MCGIAGVLDGSSGAQWGDVVREMANLLGHRGPDGSGFVDSAPAWLGHTRLAIIDVAGSPQPMTSDGGRYTLVFNGEIVNYRTLRSDHELACLTDGDTEVLLRMLERFGIDALGALRGQFAFGLWDRELGSLLLARDRLGILPLFWTQQGSTIAFASELPALRPVVEEWQFDRQCLSDLLRRRAVPAPRTTVAGIQKVIPGSWIRFSLDGTRVDGRYWTARTPVRRTKIAPAAAVERLDELLHLSVAENMIADVPVGAYLSGGVDSSLVVAIAAKHTAQPLKTFCAGFGGPDDERDHARLVADTVGTDHREVVVDASRFLEAVAEMTKFRGAPVSEVSDIAVAALAAEAVKEVKVVLSGEGSDELFAGYPKYRLAVPVAAVGRVAAAIRVPAASMLAQRGVGGRKGASLWQALEGRTPEEQLMGWFAPYNEKDLRSLGVDLRTMRGERYRVRDAVRSMEIADLETWLPDNLLERGDRMTMSASLELRPPFLDPRIIDWALALSPRIKLHRNTNKWPVRELARRYVPARLIDRPKVGFRVPLDRWLRAELHAPVRELLDPVANRSGEYLPGAYGLELLAAHLAGRDLTKKIWPLITLELYLRSFAPA